MRLAGPIDDPAPVAARTSFEMFNDEWLALKRDRRLQQLFDLAMHPIKSPVYLELMSSMQREIDGMTDELVRRARSRHPSARGRGH